MLMQGEKISCLCLPSLYVAVNDHIEPCKLLNFGKTKREDSFGLYYS
jgi:hypothetical protein